MRSFPTFWRRRFASWLRGFTPPQLSSVIQWIDNKWYDSGLDGDGILRSDDKSENGNYALKKTTPVVVDVGFSDRAVFNNEGVDFIDLGRPIWLDKLRPGVDEFTICTTLVPTVKALGKYLGVCGLGTGGAATRQFQILLEDNNLLVYVGGGAGGTSITYNINDVLCVVTTVSLTTFDVWVNEVKVISNATVGTFISNLPFVISTARGDSTQDNFEGQQWGFNVFEGYTSDGDCSNLVPIEMFPLDNFDNSQVVGTIKGTIGNITDGTPITSQDKGITYPINLNPEENEDITAKGITNAYLTREQIDTLTTNDATNTIITRPVEQNVTPTNAKGFDIVYADGTTLTQDELDKNYVHVGR